jgi:glycosyltransferase involved in cell wall biosynthesis
VRVCIVLDTEPHHFPVGGVEKAAHALCLGLLNTEHDVTLLAGGTSANDPWPGVPTVRVPQAGRRMLTRGGREWYARVLDRIQRLRPDIVHGQGLGYAGSAVVAWRDGPRVVTAHGNFVRDLRYENGLGGWALRAPLARACSRNAVLGTSVLVNVTPDWKVNCPVKPRAVVHIPNPVDDDFFAATAAPVPGVVAFFGGNKRIKGSDLLLRAWPLVVKERPDAWLNLYGYDCGDERLPPRCSAQEALRSSSDTAAAMGRANVVVLPSRFEVAPLVAEEAMAVGVPLVATDVGGVRSMTEGVAGLCQADPVAIATQLVSALRGSAEWTALVREGKRRAEAFRRDLVIASYLSVYDSLI